MRNLKRALSLTLASVMLLGMMVVGSSAAAGYDDVADTDNVEAIEVLQAIEVMVGDERGFGPERPVNRAEMAVVMGKLLNLDYNYYDAICPFNDVYDWARGWVGACYANGIVSGRGEGVYDPGTTVTAVEAASMLMRALGYFKYQSDYADGFEVATVRQAKTIGLFDGVNSNTNEPLTRNQVAQMALNALKSGMVTADGNALNFIDGNGNVIATGGKVNYVYVTSNKNFATAISSVKASSMGSSNDAPIVELGEQLYDGKLKLDDGALDVFGRPSRKWEYDGKTIGTYMKKELMVMDNVGKVTGNDLYTLLGAGTIKDYDVLVTIDGVDNARTDSKDILGNNFWFDEADMNRNNKAEVGGTGTGVLTQVFVDHEDDEVYVAIINTYLARASRDYDEKSEEATLTVYSIDKKTAYNEYVKVTKSTKDSESIKVQVEDFDMAKDVKKDDPYLVTVAEGEIQTIQDAEVLDGVALSAFKLTDHVVSGGTDYNYTTTVGYKDGDLDAYTGGDVSNLKDRTYKIFLDAYGNLIGLEEVDAVKNYVFLTGIDLDGSNLYNKTATANALFLDGTSKVITIDMTKSKWTAHEALNNTNIVISGDALLNTWATYTVNGSMYTITEVHSTRDVKTGADIPANVPTGSGNGTKLAQYHQYSTNYTAAKDYKTDRTKDSTIDVKYLRLDGGGIDGKYTWVYGDSDSVYLTAELDELMDDKSTDESYGIISDVDSIATGIADTSITVWSLSNAIAAAETAAIKANIAPAKVAQGIYTLYNDEGIVIAAVVVGESEGVKDLVYVHTDAPDLESDNGGSSKAANDGLWTWTRRVIRDGKEATLTEVDDALTYLGKDQMKQYEWYEIKTNANGEVIKATPAFEALGVYTVRTADGEFVVEYKDINDRVESSRKDTVLYQTSGGPQHMNNKESFSHIGLKADLDVIGSNTLAVTTLDGSGIHFRNNVNVVLQYYNQNTKKEEIVTDTGVDALKNMVKFVNDNNDVRGGDLYYLSALIEKGFATTIVIYDSYNNYKRPDVSLGTYELTLGGVLNSIYSTSEYSNSDVYIVNADRSIKYVESNDDIATSTVNGYKRYTVPYGETIRIYDNDMAADFLPFFSPIKALSDYNYDPHFNAQRAYIEFRVDERLANNKLTIRERLESDGIYVGVAKDAKVDVTIDGVKYDSAKNFIAYIGDVITATPNAADATVYVNGKVLASPYRYTVTGSERDIIISTTGGSEAELFDITVKDSENGKVTSSAATGKLGDEITLTVDPADGYELDTLKVNGTAVTVTDGKYTFKLAGNTTVEATFKVETPAGNAKLTLDMTYGYVNVKKGDAFLTAGKDNVASVIGSINKGDVINIQPHAVFTVNGEDIPADGNVTVDGDITIAPKAEFSWDPIFRAWATLDGIDRNNVVVWNLASLAANMANPAAKRFSLARAVSEVPPIDTGNGETDLKWQTNDNWFSTALAEGLNIELRAYVNGKLAIRKVELVGNTIKFTMVGEVTNAEFNSFISDPENLQNVASVGVKDAPVNPGKPDTIVPPMAWIDPVSGKPTMAWYNAVSTVTAPTQTEMRTEVAKLYPDKAIEEINISGTTATVKFSGEATTEAVTLERYWKVTVDNGTKVTKYVKNSSGSEDFDANGWEAYMDASNASKTGSADLTANSATGKITVSGVTKDMTYVRAVAVAATSGSDITMTRVMPDGTTSAPITPTTGAAVAATEFVPVGVELTLKYSVASNKSASLTVENNKGTTELDNQSNDTAASKDYTYKYTIKPEDVSKLSYKVGFAVTEAALTLKLGNVDVVLSFSDQSNLASSGVELKVSVPEGYYVPVQAKGSANVNSEALKVYTDPTTKKLMVKGSITTALDDTTNYNVNSVLKLMPAVSLKVVDADTVAALVGTGAAKNEASNAYINGADPAVKADLADTEIYATKDAMLDLGLAAANIAKYDVIGYSVNGDTIQAVGTKNTVSALAGSATGKTEIVFSLMNAKAESAVVADIAKMPTENDTTTPGKHVVGSNVGVTDPVLVDKQDVTASGNKITVNNGITVKDIDDAEKNTTTADAGKIMGKALADWGFTNMDKLDRFVVLAFKAPDTVKGNPSSVSDVVASAIGLRLKDDPTKTGDCAVDFYDETTRTAYVLFQYGPTVKTHIFSITWNVGASTDTVTCEYEVVFNP